MFLKTYEGDAEDLCLTFTVTNDNFGRNVETNLVANGANIDVSDTNKHHYIGESELSLRSNFIPKEGSVSYEIYL